ncbi:MAG: anthranilate synthase component I family protein [Planctomycetota bacterium]
MTGRPPAATERHAPAHAAVAVVPEAPADPLRLLAAWAGRPHLAARVVAGRGHRGAPWSYVAADPLDVLEVPRWPRGRSLADVLAPLGTRPGGVTGRGLPPFASGWLGMLGYEARSGVEATPAARRAPLGLPVVWFGRYERLVAVDHAKRRTLAVAHGTSARDAARAARELAREVARALRAAPPTSHEVSSGAPRPAWTRDHFLGAVRAARAAIRRGDIFQTNVSQRIDARVGGPSVAWFERLAAAQPAPYMTYLDLGSDRAVLSASPERFLRLRGRTLETEPMKGTRPRGATREEDAALRDELLASAKDRAELAMIVDLARNDLARSCRAGSVRVVTPRRLVRFARVHQAIGIVRGTLRPDADRLSALAAAFPPGSVTGAPKVRAMEILDELEGEGRGPYCGALGWLDDRGDMDLAVAIRTIVRNGARAAYRVGGGITLGSDPVAEWHETITKGRGLFAALAGREDPT